MADGQMKDPSSETKRQAELTNWLARAGRAMKEAIRGEVEERRRRGDPIYVWKDGKVVDVNKKD